jgi:hypothetical protein
VTLTDRVLLWEGGQDFPSDRESFHYHYWRRLTEYGELIREKTREDTIPRDYQ